MELMSVRKDSLLIAYVLLAIGMSACGSNSDVLVDPASLGPVPETWVVDAGTRITFAVSSSTLIMPDGTWRTYLPGGVTATSNDGLTWSAVTKVGLTESETFGGAVVRLSSGTFVMIYEAGRTFSSLTGGKFFRATSTDGIKFTKTSGSGTSGAVIEPLNSSSFVSVPEIVILPDGKLRLYFVGSDGNRMESALSSDLGLSWTREGLIEISGMASDRTQVDPDVIILSNGSYRLYFTAPTSGRSLSNKRIYSATSTDGRTFLLDAGERIGVSDGSMDNVDPDVVKLSNGKLRMYYGFKANEQSTYDLKSATTQ